jgi:phosphate:Na+ symporter
MVLAAYPAIPPLIAGLEADPSRAIADFHTAFNLALAIVFLPLLTPYARLLERLLPSRPENRRDDTPRYLASVAEDTPVAEVLGGAVREALRLPEALEQMIAELREAFNTPDRKQIVEARRLDNRLDRLSSAIKENLLGIAPDLLSEADTKEMARILTFSIDLEQAGDLIDRGLLGIANRRIKRGVSFSQSGMADLVAQMDRLQETLRRSTAVFLSGDLQAARALATEKEVFRRLEDEATAAHFERLRSRNIETIETSALHLDPLRDLKQISSHLIEASAYPILRGHDALLASRLRESA